MIDGENPPCFGLLSWGRVLLDFALFSEKLTKNRYFYRNPR
ncbi:hypothetical protein LSS_05373 [Leptospira santarosai serovar Shermani str. LT 821]|uniref:Uncharacterized protein n=1 Tax=Leptospira santarosai serovar Shermani str. LT 821 TaxID=758847 RepID=K8Y2R1_9LEPT|nr:hypothetical protein LSS_05373 [Leptospira santarosai serovar Shermani str. LT 821]